MMFSFSRYGKTRYWEVRVDGELLAVVVYRKGAAQLVQLLAQLAAARRQP